LTVLAGSAPLLLALSLLLAYVLVTLSHDRRAWLLVASVLVPIAGAAVISLAKPVFVGRYLIVVLPPLALLAAWGIASIPQRLLGAGAAVLLGVMLVSAMPSAFRDTRQQDWRSAGDWVAERSQDGDAMIARNGRRALAYYVAAFGGSVPQNTNVRVALQDAGPDRVWVAVLGEVPPGQEADVPRRLSTRYEVTERHMFGGRLSILLMTRTPFD
jgi:hypothetical protein